MIGGSPEFLGSVGSVNDRLSTIPEDSRSQELEDLESVPVSADPVEADRLQLSPER